MYPVIQVAGLALNTAGLMLLLAGWLGLSLAGREAKRLGIEDEAVWDAAFYAVIVGLLSARLWYVAANWSAYRSDLRQVLALNLGTLALGPGAAIGLIAALVYLRRREVPLLRLADALAPGMLLGLAVFRLGDYLTGRVLGTPTDVAWAVEMWGVRRHPVALYEMGAALIALAVVWRLRERRRYEGFTFAIALFLAAAERLLLETYRADSPLMAGGIRVPQVVALAVMLATLALLYRKHFGLQETVAREQATGRELAAGS